VNLLALSDLDAGAGRALLDATVAMGFSEEVARAGLRAELDAWRAPGALDRLRATLPPGLPPGRLPRTVLVIAARTLPASAMRAVLRARLLGARVILKPASGQAALARALAAADPEVEARPFGSDQPAALAAAIAGADAVIVLGSDASVAAVRAATPASRTFVGHGHKLSVAWLRRVDAAAAAGLARDLCAWDQAGCLSPQVVWTREAPDVVAGRLADAVAAVEAQLPMVIPEEARLARHAALARAQMLGGAHLTATAIVAWGPGAELIPGPGYRFLWVLPADEAALAQAAPLLSSVATDEALPLLPPSVRRCLPGEMQRPPLDWAQDGYPPLGSLLLRQ